MLTIKPAGWDSGDEELRAIGVLSGIGHREESRFGMFYLEVLVFEFFSVDRFTSSAVEVGEVSSLEHELRDHPVEDGTLVAISLLSIAKLLKVLSGFGDDIIVKFEGDPAERACLGCDVEKDLSLVSHVEINIDRILFKFDLNQHNSIQKVQTSFNFSNYSF